MIRTQIYLTHAEREKLVFLVKETGQSQSDLIREAIDQFVEHKLKLKIDRQEALQAARGLWEDREDLPDFSKLRKEFDERKK